MILCVLMEGFFSGSEIAVVSMNRAQLRYLVKKGSARAKSLSSALENPEWLLGATLLGTNLATVTLNAVATLFVIEQFGSEYQYLTIAATFPLMLVFGEVLPKTIFQRFSDRIAPQVIFPLRTVSWLFSPMVVAIAGVSRFFAFITGIHTTKKTPLVTREELELVFRAFERPQGVKDLERRMIDRIFSLSDRQATDIMIPLVNVVSIRDDITLAEASAEMRRSGFSRLPVFSGNVYNIVGWVNQYDLLFAKDPQTLVGLVARKVRFMPANTPVERLLVIMQRAGDTLAIVVDEYGGAIGLVTLEDVLEEVVGEIEDEYDVAASAVRRLDTNKMLANGRMPVVQLNELLPQPIPLGDYETLGGFLLAQFQRIPTMGEEYRYRRLIFRVIRATDRSIDEVEITFPERRTVSGRKQREERRFDQ
ncbi:MAG TPA: hemolysin family protein [Bdellovibrionota bacterium]|nr:hemolysin family protein [Bdellovibrionota bacterium]